MKGLSLLVCFAFVILLILKMTSVTPDLSWWWVTCPLWGSTIVYYAVVVVLFAGGSTINALSSKKES